MNKSSSPRAAHKLISSLTAAVVLTSLGSAPGVFAAAKTWTGNTDGNWADGTNWNPSAPVAGDNLLFGTAGTVAGQTITGVTSLSLGSATAILFNVGASAYTIGTVGGGATFTFTGGGITNSSSVADIINVDIDMGSTIRTFNTSAVGADLTMGGNIAGTGGLTKSNAGTLTLNGANTYSGTTSLNAGITGIGNNAAFGTSLLKINASSLTANTSARTLDNVTQLSASSTINAGQDLTFSALGSFTNFGGSRTLTVNNNTTLAGNVFLSELTGTGRTLIVNGGGAATISGAVSNFNGGAGTAGILSYTGTGTLTLSSSASTYSGGFLLNNAAATLALGADSTPSTVGSSVTSGPLGTGTFSFTNGTLTAVGAARTVANAITFANTNSAIGGSQDLTLNGAAAWGGTNTLTVSNAGTTTFGGVFTLRSDTSVAVRTLTLAGAGNTVFNGAIVNGSSLQGTMVFNNTGTTQLNGNNSYSGVGTIGSGATVKLGNANGLGFGGLTNVAGGTTVSAGGTLDLGGQSGVNEVITLNGTGVGTNGALINSNTGATAVIGNGVSQLTPGGGAAGSGNSYSAAPTVTINNGGGATAVASLGVSSTSFTINGGTTTYSAAPTVTITGGGGIGATATAVLNGSGVVTGVTITVAGRDFATAPTIAFTGGTVLVAGTNPTGTGNATSFSVGALQMTSAGSGITGATTVSFDSGTATATTNNTSVALGSATSIGGAGNIIINSAVTGGNTLTKVGAGALSLAGTNTYNGATTVSNGALYVNGTNSASPTTTVTSGVLGGNGGTMAAIAINSTGQLRTGFNATGAHFGTVNTATSITPNLTATSLSLASTATYVLDIGAATGVTNGLGNPIGLSSFLSLSGNFSPGGSTLLVNDNGVSVAVNEVFKFVQYAGTWDNSTFGTITSAAGNTYSINYAAGDPFVELTVQSLAQVPEPGTWALMLSGIGLLATVQRFRRKN